MEEPDVADQVVQGVLRVGLTVGARVGEQMMAIHQERLRASEAASLQEAAEMRTRFDAERLAARAQLAVVHRDDWWESAQVEEIVDNWQTASMWRSSDPQIDLAAQRIEEEVRTRFHIEVSVPEADPRQVQARLERIRDASESADEQLRKAHRDEAEAAQIILLADRMEADREAGMVDDVVVDEERESVLRKDAARLLENADRHRSAGGRYSHIVESETREAKQIADRSQPLAVVEAVAAAPKKAPKARKVRQAVSADRGLTR